MDERNDGFALRDPYLSAEQLRDIAYRDPASWSQVLAHPACYPGLAQWIEAQAPELRVPDAPAIPSFTETIAQPASPSTFPSVPAVGTPVPDPVVPKRSAGISTVALVGLIVGVAAGTLAIAFGGWFLFLRGSDNASVQATMFANMPVQDRVVDLSALGEPIKLVPVGPAESPYLEYGDQYLIGTRGALTSAVVAVNRGDATQTPQWILPLPEEVLAQGCTLEADHLACGTGETQQHFDMGEGLPVPLPPGESADGHGQNEDPETGDMDNPADSSGEDDSDEDANSTETPSEDEAPTFTTPTFPVTGSATEDTPFTIEDASLINMQGQTVVEDLPPGDYWASPVGDSSLWVLTDGTLIVALDGNRELWRTELPAGSAELNGFTSEGTPSWVIHGTTIMVATPEGIIALDVMTGEEQWGTDTPVTSWEATSTTLIVTTGDNLIISKFNSEAAVDESPSPGEPEVPEVVQVGPSREPRPQLARTGGWDLYDVSAIVTEPGVPGATLIPFSTTGGSPRQIWEELGEVAWLDSYNLVTSDGNVYNWKNSWDFTDANLEHPVPLNAELGINRPAAQVFDLGCRSCPLVSLGGDTFLADLGVVVIYQDGTAEFIPADAATEQIRARGPVGPSGIVGASLEWPSTITFVTADGDVHVEVIEGEQGQSVFTSGQVQQACTAGGEVFARTEDGKVLTAPLNGGSDALNSEIPLLEPSPLAQQISCSSYYQPSGSQTGADFMEELRNPVLLPRLFAVSEDGSVQVHLSLGGMPPVWYQIVGDEPLTPLRGAVDLQNGLILFEDGSLSALEYGSQDGLVSYAMPIPIQ